MLVSCDDIRYAFLSLFISFYCAGAGIVESIWDGGMGFRGGCGGGGVWVRYGWIGRTSAGVERMEGGVILWMRVCICFFCLFLSSLFFLCL